MKKISILLFGLCALILSSCMTTRTDVGNYRNLSQNKSQVYTYARGKQLYLFWGLVPLGRTKVNTPPSGNCQIRTSYNFWDALLSSITGGLFEMQTIKVKAIKGDAGQSGNAAINITNEINNSNSNQQE